MRFARLGPVGAEIPVVWDGGAGVRSAARSPTTSTGRSSRPLAVATVRAALDAGVCRSWRMPRRCASARPIARPSAVYCIGMNYAAHAAESGSAPPENLVMFMKAPNTVVGPDDDIPIPRGSVKTDWEVELGIVIGAGRRTSNRRTTRRAHIAGYVIAQRPVGARLAARGLGRPVVQGQVGSVVLPARTVARHPRRGARRGRAAAQLGERRAAAGLADVRPDLRHRPDRLGAEPAPDPRARRPHPHRHARGRRALGPIPLPCSGDVVELEIDGLGRQRQNVIAG